MTVIGMDCAQRCVDDCVLAVLALGGAVPDEPAVCLGKQQIACRIEPAVPLEVVSNAVRVR